MRNEKKKKKGNRETLAVEWKGVRGEHVQLSLEQAQQLFPQPPVFSFPPQQYVEFSPSASSELLETIFACVLLLAFSTRVEYPHQQRKTDMHRGLT